MKDLLQEILSGKYEVIGYDLKKDLERIEAYVQNGSNEIATGQL